MECSARPARLPASLRVSFSHTNEVERDLEFAGDLAGAGSSFDGQLLPGDDGDHDLLAIGHGRIRGSLGSSDRSMTYPAFISMFTESEGATAGAMLARPKTKVEARSRTMLSAQSSNSILVSPARAAARLRRLMTFWRMCSA